MLALTQLAWILKGLFFFFFPCKVQFGLEALNEKLSHTKMWPQQNSITPGTCFELFPSLHFSCVAASGDRKDRGRAVTWAAEATSACCLCLCRWNRKDSFCTRCWGQGWGLSAAEWQNLWFQSNLQREAVRKSGYVPDIPEEHGSTAKWLRSKEGTAAPHTVLRHTRLLFYQRAVAAPALCLCQAGGSPRAVR